MTDEQIISRIMSGDASIFNEVSRWDIYTFHKLGMLKNAPDSMRGYINNALDDCRISQ